MDYIKVHGAVTGFLAPIGIVMNICAIIVLSNMSSKTATTLLLRTLALSDIVYLSFSFAIWTIASSYITRGDVTKYVTNFGPISSVLQICLDISRISTTWITFGIIFSRYLSIHYTFVSQKICKTFTAGLAGVLILLLVTSSRIPLFLLSRESFNNQSIHNATVPQTVIENLILGVFWNNVYFVIDGSINLVLPVVLNFILTHRVKTALHEAYEQRRRMSNYGHEPEKGSGATMTLITVTFMHIICCIPGLIFFVLRTISNGQQRRDTDAIPLKPSLIPTKVVSNMFFEWNAFVHFFIYYIVSKEFKVTFSAILFRRKNAPKKKEENGVVRLPHISENHV